MVSFFSFLVQTFVCVLWIIDVHTVENHEECGHPIGSYSTGKIVGGYDVGYYKYPWYVALKKDGDVFCGGTLISSKFIVTAAHCFQPFFKAVDLGHMTLEGIFKPTFGVYNVCRHESTQKEFQIAKVHVHEKYKKLDPYFDIALIKLKQEAKGYQPCCLPDKASDSRTRPKEGYVSGLGDQRFNSRISTCTMHEARILIYNDDVCRNMLDSQGEEGKKLQHAFCAGYLEGGIDACQGDSGGPLIIADSSGRFSLLGITSFGFECAKPDTLGIYTDATHYLDWIRERLAENVPRPTPSTSPSPLVPTPQSTDSSAQGTSIDWGVYPVTEWEGVPDSPPPWEGIPPTRPPHHNHHPPISIVINFWKRQRKERNLRKKKMIQYVGKRSKSHRSGGGYLTEYQP